MILHNTTTPFATTAISTATGTITPTAVIAAATLRALFAVTIPPLRYGPAYLAISTLQLQSLITWS